MRMEGGRAPLWHLHVRRLSESCLALGVPLPRKLIVPGGPDRVLRWEIGSQGIEASERPLPSTAPLRLITSRIVHRPYPHKTTDRATFDRARAEAVGRGADDAVLLTPSGEVAECAIWSLFWWEDDGLLAPPPSLGILGSVSRLRIAELLEPVGGYRPYRPYRPGQALVAANAVRGIVPVDSLDGAPVPGDLRTARLAAEFWP